MKMIFIRHGETAGNLSKSYIGRTDEPLCRQGIERLKNKVYPDCSTVISSSMKRCIQTADIIYPDKKRIICPGLNECDFGSFEGKNYAVLKDDEVYQQWLVSGGTLPFPGGESLEQFKERCASAFRRIVLEICDDTVAFTVHGGTIMAILSCLALPVKDFYDYILGNGCYYTAEYDGKNIRIF